MDALVSQVNQMLSERLPFREIEDRIEGMPLSEEEKSALWLLAWAGQPQRVQRRSVEEALTHAGPSG